VAYLVENSVGFTPLATPYQALSSSSILPLITNVNKRKSSSSWNLHLFGKALGDAFQNDKALGKPSNAGLNKVRWVILCIAYRIYF